MLGFELIEYGVLHDEEFFSVFLELSPTYTLPYVERFEGAALVHEEARGLGHKEHAYQHDGRKDEGGAEHITPAAALLWSLASAAFGEKTAYLDVHEYSSHNIAEDLTESDVELVEGDQISTVLPSHGFGNVDRYLRS